MKNINYKKLLSSLLIAFSAGFIGSIFTTSSVKDWYPMLNKPDFNPPSWVFAPVWNILFAMMGIALYLVWQRGLKNKKVKFAFWFFVVHLAFNSLWSILFFGLKNPGWALAEIVILWLMILVSIIYFYKINKWAGWLLVPYLLWVSFATVLNYNIWILN